MGIADQLSGAGVGTKAVKPTNPPKKPKAPQPEAVQQRLPEGITRALLTPLPAENEDPKSVAAACTERISASITLREAIEHYAEESFFRYAGPAVRRIYRAEGWRHLKDPETGKPFRGFRAWLRWQGISKSQAYRMVDEEPVREALGLADGTLEARQVAVLAPVLRQYGAVKLRELWQAAETMGGTSPAKLKQARAGLELTELAASDSQVGPDGDGKSRTAPLILRVQPGRFDESLAREYARQDPELARVLAQTLLDEVERRRSG
ncbi:hypothetical protein [Streptomyces sp. NPDC007063]|uniref:hypothetical protein n=1 Tax=Streptomyces sp. NPDC007063 TaxID=3364772 RepID=UPI0036A5AF91